MADKQSNSSPGVVSNSFSKGMIKDFNETFVGEGFYTHARNAANNSHDGQVGVIGNEPSNIKCVQLPYDLIGAIHTIDDIWVIYTTDDIDSEIGLFDESQCKYTKIVNDPCLGFKRSHLITGAFRIKYDCERLVYWDDNGLNPTRFMDIDNVPWKQNCRTLNGCTTCVDTNVLNCEALRIAPLLKHPCIKLKKGNVAGTLPNGSYQVCIAYTVNQVKVTDYIGLTEVQGLFTHENVSSSLEVIIESIDKTFDEFELIVLSNINAQTTAKRIGYYSTAQGTIFIDRWDPEYATVGVGQIVFRSDAIEKTDAMYTVNNYLLRVGVYSKFKFNYQLLANKIITKWQAVQYPANYYSRGGNNTSYLRDEQYPFFIRWIYNTGDRTESYHIPGRAPSAGDKDNITGADAFETLDGVTRQKWQVENTATVDTLLSTTLPDGGVIIAQGKMGYWESTELYPSNRADIWGTLCGKPIRHHKMPDETVDPILSSFNSDGNNIVLLGVQFSNIAHPLDNNGNPIESIIGYEILRGSREGNKSIIAKGLLNNLREYNIPENNVKGLLPNYPYNDLRPDTYLTPNNQDGTNGTVNVSSPPLSGAFNKNIFTFHSPETTFNNPFLNVAELKIYQENSGTSTGYFQVPYKHPKFKIGTDFASIISKVGGLMAATAAVSKGVAVGATENIPISLQFGPIGKPSAFPTAAGGDVSGSTVTAAAWAKYALDLVLWVAETGSVIALASSLADVQSEKLYELFKALIPKIQYAAQYNSHGFYNNITESAVGNRRRKILNSIYLGSNIQGFTSTASGSAVSYQINNINRSRSVVIETDGTINDPVNQDNSRFTMGEANINISDKAPFKNISSHYGGLKLSIPSQYGQLDSIKQLVSSDCVFPTKALTAFRGSTSTIFGGDIYINRFTEKNTMFFFNDWLMGQPDNIEYDYTLYQNVPYTRFWVNNTEKHSFFNLANNYRVLDRRDSSTFFVKKGYFYLFNSGVRDFFVESEINLAYRDWEIDPGKRHYDNNSYTDLNSMFRSDIIQNGNYYKYDYSLSVSKLFNSSISWGNLLPRDYDPLVAATCYTYRPNTVIYSLPQQDEAKKDNWRVFLANNFKNFTSPVTGIKQVNKTGALFMMKWQSPLQFMGVEELKLDATGSKITIGDAGLFTGPQQLQAIVNADASYEYASNQGRYSAINTKYGIFWVSQNQGKVFNYIGQLDEISNNGLKWWMAKYLPSELLKVYPDYPLYDNPLKGVGVQMVYDNTNEIIYITKKDYKPKYTNMVFDAEGNFYLNNTNVSFLDPDYFENASWTMSYDPKTKAWVSFHDWIPSFLLPGRNHFMTVNNKSIWKHNITCTSYCNYYGVDYPFEIEFVSATGQTVTSMRSIEYLLEVYRYHNDCRDKYHVLDENFDQAMVYNSEQISGLLYLSLKAKNNPLDLLTYPRITNSGIDINFSKEENKYRFNQFWDVTKNRGEYTTGFNIPMFNTEANGYKYVPNPNYINYSKDPLQRKKFRHNVNRVWMRKGVSGNNKFLFKLSNQKLLQSPR